MTAPDNGMEAALRRALTEAVSQVEPGTDALERIQARVGERPPRPWLLSVAADVLDRARHWTWRGHWAWQLSGAWPTTMLALSALPWPRLLRLPRPGVAPAGATPRPGPARRARVVRLDSVNWLRPVAVLAGIAIIASVSFGVQPFRQAIIQASSTVLSGGSQPQTGGADTDGSGTPTGDSTSAAAPGMPPADTYGVSPGRGATAPSGAASASPAPSGDCPPSLMVDWAKQLVSKKAGATGSVTSAAPSTVADLVPSVSPSPTPSPSCAGATSKASPTPSPTVSATPTATATSPTPTATATSPTPTATATSPTPTGTPTATPTGTGSVSPTAAPTDSSGDTGNDGGGTTVGGTPSDTPSATSS